ncbi:MAG: flagellin [Alphaproteobacteria bacterium]
MAGISTLATTMEQIGRIKNIQANFSLLSFQLSTNKKTDKFSGLGSDVLISKRARADFKSLEVYDTNITLANNRINQSLAALQEFRKQSENLRAFLINFSKSSPHQEGEYIRQDDPLTPGVETTPIGLSSGNMDIDFVTMTNFARNIEGFMQDLINRRDGDRYLFAGADSLNKPLIDTGSLDTAMSNAILNWKNEGTPTSISTADFIADLTQRQATGANPDAFTDTVVGFNSALASGNSGNVFARINDQTEVNYTSLGNSQGLRDIMVAVSFLKNPNLPPIADVYNEPYTFGDMPVENGAPGATLEEQLDNFLEVFQVVTNMVSNALKEIDKEIQQLEMARVRLNDAANFNRDQRALAKDVISDVEDVDLNEVAVKINALQVSLEASYRVTALTQQLSLVNFI